MPRGRRIVLTTFGSLGDVSPLIALGRGLRCRGHSVTIATSEGYRASAERAGLRLAPVRPHEAPAWLLQPTNDLYRHTRDGIRSVLFAHLRESYEDLSRAVDGADLLISHMLGFAGPLVAEQRKIPWISVVLQPLGFMSRYETIVVESAAAGNGIMSLDAAGSLTAMRLGWQEAYRWAEPVRALRAELGLPPGSNPIYDDHHSPDLVLALFSTLFARPRPDWPVHTQITGFVFDDRASSPGQLPARIQAFLSSGPAPIVVTLGSHSIFDSGNFYVQVVSAAASLGQRILLLGAGTERVAGLLIALNPWLRWTLLACEYAPYSAVFPHASVIVHHGGIGSIAAALQAGRPMLAVPLGFDQLHNAWLAESGSFARVVASGMFNARLGATELLELLGNPKYQHAAAIAALVVHSENGLARACDAIEQHLIPVPT